MTLQHIKTHLDRSTLVIELHRPEKLNAYTGIMQTELITVRPSDSVREAARMMLETKVGCLLVTEEDNTLVGIVTESDFIKLSIWFLDRTEVVEAD